MKIEYEFQLTQVLALGLVKLSVLYFYRRIFSVKAFYKPFDVAALLMTWTVILWTILFFFAFLFSCGTHIDANWTTLENSAQYCVIPNLIIALVSSDMICDFLILMLPLPMVCYIFNGLPACCTGLEADKEC